MADEHLTGNEVDFVDGKGPKSDSTPDHFPSDWHYREHLRASEANIAGLKHRVLELEGMDASTPEQIAAAKDAVKEAEKQLAADRPKAKQSRPKAKPAAKRPAKAARENTLRGRGSGKETR